MPQGVAATGFLRKRDRYKSAALPTELCGLLVGETTLNSVFGEPLLVSRDLTETLSNFP